MQEDEELIKKVTHIIPLTLTLDSLFHYVFKEKTGNAH